MADRELLDKLRAQMGEIESGRCASSIRTMAASGDDAVFESSKPEPDDVRAENEGGAFKKIVALVNASDKSEHAIRRRLAASGFEEGDIERAVSRARDYALIDDERFAEVLVRSRYNQGRGIAGIERELAENEIEPERLPFWDEWVESAIDAEIDRAVELLKRKPPRAKNKRDAAYRKLVQKGYSSSVSSTAARLWSEAR